MMFEIAFQRFFDDLVVTMILALTLKGAFPCVAILQLGARNDFREALGERNGFAMRHRKNVKVGEQTRGRASFDRKEL
jgi:hypothetical protein